MMRINWRIGAVAAVVGVALAGPALAQTTVNRVSPGAGSDVDARWTPWLGCWREFTDPAVPEDLRVCVLPADGAGVMMTTQSGQRVLIDQRVIADGVERDVDEPATGCRGWRRAEWSVDGLRLFTRAELSCPGQPAREVRGLLAIGPGGVWIDAQHVTSEDGENVRVRRYRRTVAQPGGRAGLTPETAARAAAAAAGREGRLTVDDVIEAAAQTSQPIVEALLVETESGFRLDSEDLIRLDEAGVSDDLVDLMVALSYPEEFAVDQGFVAEGRRARYGGPILTTYPFDPWWYGTYYPYYYYSPFGYAYYGRYGFGSSYYGAAPYGVRGGVDRGNLPRGSGRVVNGRGYTRVRPRSFDDGRVNRSSGGSPSGGRSRSTGGASGGRVSPRGATSGGSSGESSSGGGGRTAVPR